MSIDTVTRDDFAGVAGSTFALRDESGSELELRDVSPERAASGWATYALIFQGDGASLEQGIHALSHPVLGDLDIFLVPVGADNTGTWYEAIFTHAVPEGA